MPGGISQALTYDGPGRVIRDSIKNGSVAAHKYTFDPLRKTALLYDGRDKLRSIANTKGAKDTTSLAYTGLGHTERSVYTDHGQSAFDATQTFRSDERFRYDALGNSDTSFTSTTGGQGPAWETWSGARKSRYHAGTGRVRAVAPPTGQTDTLWYDPAGNQRVLTFAGASGNLNTDRVSYFDAEQRLRVVDYRVYQASPGTKPIVSTFEEYRYDALGRRVLVRTRRACNAWSAETLDCGLHWIRRTVWQGQQELIEIQMPGHDSVGVETLENDSAVVRKEKVYGVLPGQWLVDPNPFYGRVYYTPGLVIDQPLAVTRWGLQDSVQALGQFERYLNPFTIVPHWNVRGVADMGTFADGSGQICGQSTVPSTCLQVAWPFGWTVYQQRQYGKPLVWHGTILDQKREGSALLFRRTRFLDPSSGRFTQEDPIGLAGGLNVYGFAHSDPANLSDPFGLCTPPDSPECRLILMVAARTRGLLQLQGAMLAVASLPTLGMGGGALTLTSLGGAAGRASATSRVIGSYPGYLQVGEALGAKVFDVPLKVWNTMSEAAQWAANQRFLDRGIKEGSEFVLTTLRSEIRRGSALEREVGYLLSKGYRWAENGMSLVPK